MNQRGNASVAVLGASVVVMILLLGLADLGMFLVARSRAQTAADAAALAAAGEQLGKGEPAGAAAYFAESNGAALVSCECPPGGLDAVVRVSIPVRFVLLDSLGVGEVGARARAEVDLARFGDRRS